MNIFTATVIEDDNPFTVFLCGQCYLGYVKCTHAARRREQVHNHTLFTHHYVFTQILHVDKVKKSLT